MTALADPQPIRMVRRPLDAVVVVPGSKSLSNRALVCAGLAAGTTVLDGLLRAEDTLAMIDCLRGLGVGIADATRSSATGPIARDGPVTVVGVAGHPAPGHHRLFVRESGTTARFVAAMCALGNGTYEIDAAPSMRARPMGATFDALRSMGVGVTDEDGHLPATITSSGLRGATLDLAESSGRSSQFVSGLLLAGGAMSDGLTVSVGAAPVSWSYILMTTSVMGRFGVDVALDVDSITVRGGGYGAVRRHHIEPDASAASYFFAAAAVCGGRVRIDGLGARSLQGDVGFVRVLEAMGADIDVGDAHIEVRSDGRLHGVTVDMSDISDTAQTLAAIAPFADSPTEVTGIGFIRHKETDRIAAVVTELRRCGIDAKETDDGFVIRPGAPGPAEIRTYGDHRMAMSFAVLGLAAEGISIRDPGCVAKTFPGFWETLEEVRR